MSDKTDRTVEGFFKAAPPPPEGAELVMVLAVYNVADKGGHHATAGYPDGLNPAAKLMASGCAHAHSEKEIQRILLDHPTALSAAKALYGS